MNLIQLTYLCSAILFVFSLKCLSSLKQAKFGNIIGILAMFAAISTTFFLPAMHHNLIVIVVMMCGALIGGIIARKIAMTAIPELIAAFHSLVGAAAVFIAYSALLGPENFGIGIKGAIHISQLIEISLGVVVGAVTFTGSCVAFAKLRGFIKSAPIKFYAQEYLLAAIFIAMLFLIFNFVQTQQMMYFHLIVILSLTSGILLIIPVGGADVPVIVSMLNAYSGLAAAGIGFTSSNNLLIITGALVCSSGTILSYIMCRGMNRSLTKVIFGAFLNSKKAISAEDFCDKVSKNTNAQEAAHMLKEASSIIIVPGYGMATAQSQHIIKEMIDALEKYNPEISIRFAIHPVAGRMPGHMNVLLAEANINYDKVFELEDINRDFAITDVAFVIGANDVTNPAAKHDKESPIYGMPILEVSNARNVIFLKRSMATGYAGIENELFYMQNTLMLFGDAKKVVEEIVKFVKE